MVYAIVAVIILIIDQAVKYWTTLNLAENATQDFIPNILELTNVHNDGAAYGLFSGEGARWIFVGLTVVFAILIIYLLSKDVISGKMGKWTIVMVLAGGLGNCIDRVINGYVVDMFHFQFPVFGRDYPVFNVADMFISVCGVLFCIWLIFHKREPKAAVDAAASAQRQRAAATPDYMSQLEKPVAEAKVELAEPEYIEQPVRRQAPTMPSIPTRGADPFAEFTAPAQPTRPAPQPMAKPQAAPAPAAPKKSGDEFSLDSILAEFKDI